MADVTWAGPASFAGDADNLPVDRIVMHCTVSPTVNGGARTIAAYFRGTNATGSAHYIVDPGDIVQTVRDAVTAYHAPPNRHSLGVELCDPMTNNAARWRDTPHTQMLARAAVLVAGLCRRHDIPAVRLSEADLRLGKRGICGHVDVSQAFKQSTHWDPGPDFPWPSFMAQVRVALTPPETDVTIAELVEALKDETSPLAIALRNNVRIAVEKELVDERNKANPGQ